MQRLACFVALVLCASQCLGQIGFPKQFQTKLNITGLGPAQPMSQGVQDLLYDYSNLRVRFDITGWRASQHETYMMQYKPAGAEAGSLASQDYALFNLNPDYPAVTKNNCWYRTNPMGDLGPFPFTWYADSGSYEIKAWFPLPTNLINKGEEWVPEVQMNAVRYDSPEICDLKRSGIGPVPCLSYFETADRPVKTIQARAARGAYDADDYTTTVYLTFTHGIPAEAEHLFDLPAQWPSFCGNANAGFTRDPQRGFVATPTGQDHFVIKLTSPPVRALGDQIKIEFKLQPNWYYNGTRCVSFSSIVFDHDNWQVPQQVDMSFTDYGCCNYAVTATGGGYEWQYTDSTFVVYGCDGTPGYGCDGGKYPCGG